MQGRRRLLDAILNDAAVTSANGVTLCAGDHGRAHSGELTPTLLHQLIDGLQTPARIANEKLIVRETRSLAEVYSVVPFGALDEAGDPPPLIFGQPIGFRDFVGAPFRGKIGKLERFTTTGDHVMVSFRERLAVPGCRARIHFQFDPRMLAPAR